jgi:hypothetical protein
MRNLENKEKIILVSRNLEIIARLGMAWNAFLGIGALSHALFLRDGPMPNMKTVAWFAFPTAVIGFIVWWNFWQLFRRLNDGHLFDGPTVARLATAGKWKLVGWVYSLFSLTILEYLLEQTDSHRPALEFVKLFFVEIAHVGGLTVAMAILLAAWLLREGQTMEEEQKLTV